MVSAACHHSALIAQATFRAILDATARPGTVRPIGIAVSPPAPLSTGHATVALTLCDHDTPLWLDDELRASTTICDWLRFHCGCELVDEPGHAAFALASGATALPPFDAFSLGTPDYPDRSTTLVLAVRSLTSGNRLTLSGPGVRSRTTLRAEPLPDDMTSRLAANRALFPRGIDLLLVTSDAVAAVPRSVRVVEED